MTTLANDKNYLGKPKQDEFKNRLGDLHLRLRQEEWPEGEPMTKDAVIELIAERESSRSHDTRRKEARAIKRES